MTIRIPQGFGWRRRNTGTAPRLPGLPRTSVLLLLCCAAACGIHRARVELAPRTTANPSVSPLQVGVVVDKEFVRYKVKFRYWSSPPFTLELDGLPDAFIKTLSAHFVSVEPLPAGRNTSTARHDVIARMTVDRIHFDGANTTVGTDTVDLTMTFTLGRPNGTEIFRTSVTASASSEYLQPCAFCKPDPREAYTKAFSAAFAQLSETLAVSGIRVVQ